MKLWFSYAVLGFANSKSKRYVRIATIHLSEKYLVPVRQKNSKVVTGVKRNLFGPDKLLYETNVFYKVD